MPSSDEYLEFILDQLRGLDDVSHKKMMGEFILYFKGKVVGGIYDNRLLVKDVPSVHSFLPDCRLELPYEGAKPMVAVDDVDNSDLLCRIIEAVCDALPKPKPKRSKPLSPKT